MMEVSEQKVTVKLLKTTLEKSELKYAKDALTYISKLEEQLSIARVGKRFLTVKQLYNACIENDYILVRFRSGRQMGVNTKIASLIFNKKEYKDNQSTDFVSYLPCGFHEYISKKHVFM